VAEHVPLILVERRVPLIFRAQDVRKILGGAHFSAAITAPIPNRLYSR